MIDAGYPAVYAAQKIWNQNIQRNSANVITDKGIYKTRAYTRQGHIPQLTSLAVKHLCMSILLTFLHKCLLTNQTDRRLLWNASTKTLLNNNRHYTYLYTGINVCVVAAINLGCYQARMLSNKAITLSPYIYRNKKQGIRTLLQVP